MFNNNSEKVGPSKPRPFRILVQAKWHSMRCFHFCGFETPLDWQLCIGTAKDTRAESFLLFNRCYWKALTVEICASFRPSWQAFWDSVFRISRCPPIACPCRSGASRGSWRAPGPPSPGSCSRPAGAEIWSGWRSSCARWMWTAGTPQGGDPPRCTSLRVSPTLLPIPFYSFCFLNQDSNLFKHFLTFYFSIIFYSVLWMDVIYINISITGIV